MRCWFYDTDSASGGQQARDISRETQTRDFRNTTLEISFIAVTNVGLLPSP